MKPLSLFTPILAFCLFVGVAQATSTPALVTTHDFGVHPDLIGPETIGFEFTANSSVTVDGLGVFDSGQDGLAERHQVGLWDAGGALIASTTVGAGTSAPLLGLYRYARISPTALTAGANYFVGVYAVDFTDQFYCCAYPASIDPRISLIDFGLGNSTTFRAPDFVVPQINYANFTIGSAVPEAAAWAMMLIGFGLAGASVRRLRRARTAIA